MHLQSHVLRLPLTRKLSPFNITDDISYRGEFALQEAVIKLLAKVNICFQTSEGHFLICNFVTFVI